MTHRVCEIVSIKRLYGELNIQYDGPIQLYFDNQSAISIAHNPIQHDRIKHVEVDRHFIKEKIEENIITIKHVNTGQQLVDILTKEWNIGTSHAISRTFSTVPASADQVASSDVSGLTGGNPGGSSSQVVTCEWGCGGASRELNTKIPSTRLRDFVAKTVKIVSPSGLTDSPLRTKCSGKLLAVAGCRR
ncbi:hypothetical protein LIER_22598 [Lithospermum erythrorhizon]|uniref:Copia protein n=1 Tax=Lithospermum erythrorhizon TaxID=34254 RepID=A0AAV3QW13_LITER